MRGWCHFQTKRTTRLALTYFSKKIFYTRLIKSFLEISLLGRKTKISKSTWRVAISRQRSSKKIFMKREALQVLEEESHWETEAIEASGIKKLEELIRVAENPLREETRCMLWLNTQSLQVRNLRFLWVDPELRSNTKSLMRRTSRLISQIIKETFSPSKWKTIPLQSQRTTMMSRSRTIKVLQRISCSQEGCRCSMKISS